LKAVLPQFADFDLFAHNTFPGGIPNLWLHTHWGTLTAALDSANVEAVAAAMPGIDEHEFRRCVKGPRPVDEDIDGTMLRQALAEHRGNFNMGDSASVVAFQDDAGGCNQGREIDRCLDPKRLSIYARRAAIENSGTPICYWAGWFDAGTAEGALNLFETFANPMHVVVGPWNHGRRYFQDPLSAQPTPEPITAEENFSDLLRHIESCVGGDGPGLGQRRLDYYTLGSNRWRTTTQWPPLGVVSQVFYLGESRQLASAVSPRPGSDSYTIDSTATTGIRNRWHTQIGCRPVIHEDRRDADARLLVYNSEPLSAALEIVGNPIAYLDISSDRPQLDLFVYLELIAADGSVRLITEGCLRGIHRKVANDYVAYRQFGPAHTFERRDATPIEPGVVSTFAVGLLPIAIEVPAGYRLRLAIAGADRDTFASPAEPLATIEVHRGPRHLSRLELPVLAR
jgi:putative CocE/NonD family hydrolase